MRNESAKLTIQTDKFGPQIEKQVYRTRMDT